MNDEYYMFDPDSDDFLCHVGKGHDKITEDGDPGRSGRYPRGSGENPYQHEGGFRGYVHKLQKDGIPDIEIAGSLRMTVNEMRKRISVEKTLERNTMVKRVKDLYDSGITNKSEIGRRLGIGESSVRSYLDTAKHERNNEVLSTRDMLKSEIDKYGATDIGKGTELRLGISRTKLNNAIFMLESEGYHVHNVKVKQQTGDNYTTIDIIAPPTEDKGMQWKELAYHPENIHVINETYSEDGGKTWGNIEKPVSISSKRIYVRYGEEGAQRDGMIEIRPGVKDLDMGDNHYAQVRIGVDNTNFMKGVAVYSNHVPEGYDVVYNSNKKEGAPFDKVFKPMKRYEEGPNKGEIIWDNPFGAAIKGDETDENGMTTKEIGQRHYIDDKGRKKLSAINIVREEGDWNEWSKTLASQMLSKQSYKLAQRQLQLDYDKMAREYDELSHLDNPVVKAHLLASFASDCDSKTIHLKAAALPRQRSQVIIPVPELKDNEIYAPNYKDGEIVSLIRYPHGNISEIPTLVVNNRHKIAREFLGLHPKDAVAINPKVAAQLSGADFDGDTVTVIPNPEGKLINHRPQMQGLIGFDTKQYAFPEGVIHKKVGLRTTDEKNAPIENQHDGFDTQMQMGMISNLITDMTIKGASESEIERALKHSMVVIDAEKHQLDWKQSEKDNNIKELRAIYQDGGGVSTLISRAKHEVDVLKRKDFQPNMIDPETGKINWVEVNPEKVYKDYDGTWVHTGEKNKNAYKTKKDKETGEYYLSDERKTQKSTLMDEAFNQGGDARDLISSKNTMIENVYADYANKMKALANDARKQMILTRAPKSSKEAAEEYSEEVSSLMDKLNTALKDRPLERKATAIAQAQVKLRKEDNPSMTKEDEIKIRSKAFLEARRRLGISKHDIKITPREWTAIQKGAISATKLREILTRTDMDVVRQYATPKEYIPKMSKAEIAMAKSMMDNYTTAEIAEHFGVSVSTLYNAINK